MAAASAPLAIRRFDRAEIFTLAADDGDAPASQGLLRIGTATGETRRQDSRLIGENPIVRMSQSCRVERRAPVVIRCNHREKSCNIRDMKKPPSGRL